MGHINGSRALKKKRTPLFSLSIIKIERAEREKREKSRKRAKPEAWLEIAVPCRFVFRFLSLSVSSLKSLRLLG